MFLLENQTKNTRLRNANTIWQLDNFKPLEYRTSPEFRWLLYLHLLNLFWCNEPELEMEGRFFGVGIGPMIGGKAGVDVCECWGIKAPGVLGLSKSPNCFSKERDSAIPRSITELMTSSTWLTFRFRSSILYFFLGDNVAAEVGEASCES